MFEFLAMQGNYEDRKVDLWQNDTKDKMVSTVAINDGRKPFETAVQHPAYNDGLMVIVECYDTKEESQAGHDKWLKLMLSNDSPNSLVDCANAEISQIIGDIGGNMAFERQFKD